jgi:uncharacterized metal-binding protein
MSPISIPGKVQLRKNYSGIGPLDFYGGAAAAYSLRSLSAAYTGPVVRVRRSSDNAESDFNATEVSDGTLAAWVGAGNNGFVRTWYDQSGNTRNAEQTTATNQPQIVSSGALILDGSKPTLNFDGANDNLVFAGSSMASTSQLTAIAVSQANNAGNTKFVLAAGINATNQSAGLTFNSSEQPVLFIFSGSEPASTTTTSRILHVGIVNGTAMSNFVNNNAAVTATNAGSLAINNSSIYLSQYPDAASPPTLVLSGRIQEAILYYSDLSASRSAIVDNINTYYSIF